MRSPSVRTSEGLPGHDGPGALEGLIVDVGDHVGALVLLVDELLAGSEIEVSPVGRDRVRTHAEAHPRRAGAGVVHAAVFVYLDEGGYTVWRSDGGPHAVVHVDGGTVAQLDLRTTSWISNRSG
jgi:hypothetical protein